MAYCDISNTKLGKKVDSLFSTNNRNAISNLIDDNDFIEWFQNGIKDDENNPFLSKDLTFTNEKGEKKTIFDFNINIKTYKELYDILKSTNALTLRDGKYVVNNKKGNDLKFYAEDLKKLINVLNYYYPNIISVNKTYPNNKGVPVFSVNINKNLPLLPSNKFIPYFSVEKKDDEMYQLTDLQNIENYEEALYIMQKQFNLKKEEVDQVISTPPNISEETYKILEDFIKRINPKAEIKLIEDLSTNGVAYISDFIISLRTDKKLNAMPEEVAHFFVELLPDDNVLKQDMIKNIINFPIYSIVFNQYKSRYQKEGKPDIEKIKREATAKLIAEYIYSETTGDMSRIDILTKTKKSWLKEWWNKIINWFKSKSNVSESDIANLYIQAANEILNRDITMLDLNDLFLAQKNDIFYSINAEKFKSRGDEILFKIKENPKELIRFQNLVKQFKNKLDKTFIETTTNKAFTELQEFLKNNKIGNIDEYYLANIKSIIKTIQENVFLIDKDKKDLSETNLSKIELDASIQDIDNFLHLISSLGEFASFLNSMIQNPEYKDKILVDINEIKDYRNLYTLLNNLLQSEFTDILVNNDVDNKIVEYINITVGKFNVLEKFLLNRTKILLKDVIGDMFTSQNLSVLEHYTTIIEKYSFLHTKKEDHDNVRNAVEAYRKQMLSLIPGSQGIEVQNKNEARKILKAQLSLMFDDKKFVDFNTVNDAFGKLEEFFYAETDIINVLSGGGNDIDQLSATSHLFTAAHKNYDTFIAQIAKRIISERTIAETKGNNAVTRFKNATAPLLKKLGLDSYKAGNLITEVDKIIDKTSNKKGEKYDDNQREIVTLIKPYLGQAFIDKQKFIDNMNEKRDFLTRNKDSKEAKKEFYKSKKDFILFNNKYFNSKYKKDYTDFQTKWGLNEDFSDIKLEYDVLNAKIRSFEMSHSSNDNTYYHELRSLLDEKKEMIKNNPLLDEYSKEQFEFLEIDQESTIRRMRLAQKNFEIKVDTVFDKFRNSQNKTDQSFQNIINENFRHIRYFNIIETYKKRRARSGEVIMLDETDLGELKKMILDDFEDSHTFYIANQAYKDYRDNLVKEINELKQQVKPSKIDEIRFKAQERISEITKDKKSNIGEVVVYLLTDDERLELEELDEKLKRIQKYYVTYYDISDEAKQKYPNAPEFEAYEENIKKYEELIENSIFSSTEILQARKNIYDLTNVLKNINGVIDPKQITLNERLKKLFIELKGSKENQATEEYWDMINELVLVLEIKYNNILNNIALTSNEDKLEKLKNDREDLSFILYGKDIDKDSFKEAPEGLYAAVAMKDVQLLDTIINDRYIKLAQGTNNYYTLYFSKFLEDAEIDQIYFEKFKLQGFTDYFYSLHSEGNVEIIDYRNNDAITESLPLKRRFYLTKTYPYKPEHRETRYSKEFVQYKVKDKHINKQVSFRESTNMEDWTINNISLYNSYLPFSKKQLIERGETDFTYVNKEYDNVKNNKNLFDYYNLIVSTYLERQEEVPDNLKSFLNIPVTGFDPYQENINIKKTGKRIWSHFVNFFKKQELAAEDLMINEDIDIYDTDFMTQEKIGKETKVPKLGLSGKLPAEFVNRNMEQALSEYLIKVEDFKARNDLNPLMSGLVDVMNNNIQITKTSQKERGKIIESIYKQMILQETPEGITNSKFFQDMARVVTWFTSRKLLVDLVGGVVNFTQANFNNILEAFAGKHLNMSDYAWGFRKSYDVLADMVKDYGRTSDYHFNTLLLNSFDFIHGDFAKYLTESAGTKSKLLNVTALAMSPRTSGEILAQSALALGILRRTKVNNKITKTSSSVYDIYEKKNGELSLKDGYYEEVEITKIVDGQEEKEMVKYYPWSNFPEVQYLDSETLEGGKIKVKVENGAKFNALKGKIHILALELHGNYSKLTQTEASRYAAGRLAENMKRWFVPFFQKRMGREFYDVTMDEIQYGYYRSTAKVGYQFMKYFVKGQFDHAKDVAQGVKVSELQKTNFKRLAADIGAAAILFTLQTLVFGYDSDDPDRNKKLKENSWYHNVLLLATLRSYAEQTAFIPFPGFGFTELSRNIMDPFAIGIGTLKNAVGLFTLSIFTALNVVGLNWKGEAFVRYQKDSGSIFGEKGDLKLTKFLLSQFGYTGAQLDPVYYIKNFESLQKRLK